MYRERGGGGSKAKMERSSTASSSKAIAGGLNSNGKDIIIDNNIKDRGNPNNQNSSISRSNKKPPSKGEENLVEESETDSEESDVSGSDGEDTSWISWFCSLRGNEFFCEVDENYIQDDFNLCGLSSQVPYYDYALDLILDVESSHGDMFSEEQNEIIESAAEMLYGLIHVRYILTTKGLGAMLEKYKNAEFGRCPRVYCFGQPCLPVGQSDVSRQSNVKIFCPKCEDIYTPQSRFQDTSRPGWSLFWVNISALVPDDLWTPQTTKDITGLHSSNLWLQGPQAMTSKSQIRRCASELVSPGYLPLASCNL